jgi:hypothetical protein
VTEEHVHLTSCAVEKRLLLQEHETAQHSTHKVNAVLSEVACELEKAGCRFIGHIKALLDCGEAGQIFFSITRFGQKPRQKGVLTGNVTVVHLIINAIVPDVPKQVVEKIVTKALNRQFKIWQDQFLPGIDPQKIL